MVGNAKDEFWRLRTAVEVMGGKVFKTHGAYLPENFAASLQNRDGKQKV